MSTDQTGDGPLFGTGRNTSGSGVPSATSVGNKEFPHSYCSTDDTSFTSALDLSSSSAATAPCADRASEQDTSQTSRRSTTAVPVWSGDQPSETSSAQPSSYLWDDNDLSAFLVKRSDPQVDVCSSFVRFDSLVTEIAPIFQNVSVTSVGGDLAESSRTELIPLASADTYKSSHTPSSTLADVGETERALNFPPSGTSGEIWSPGLLLFSSSSDCPPSSESPIVSNHLTFVSSNAVNETNGHLEVCSDTDVVAPLAVTDAQEFRHAIHPVHSSRSFQSEAHEKERLSDDNSVHLGPHISGDLVHSIVPHHQAISGVEVIHDAQSLSRLFDERWSIAGYSKDLVASTPINGATTTSSSSVAPAVTFGSSASAFRKLSSSIDSTNHIGNFPRTNSFQETEICNNTVQPFSVITNSIASEDTPSGSVTSSRNDQGPPLSCKGDAAIENNTCNTIVSDHFPINISKLSADMSRYSPAQVVAVTGGPPEEILRQLEYEDEKVYIARGHAQATKPPSPSSHTSPKVTARTSPVTEPLPASTREVLPTIDIQVQVNARLAPTTPEAVEASSKIIFGNFLTESYQLEITASAKATANGATANATAVTNINIDNSRLFGCDASASASAELASGNHDAVSLSDEFASIPHAEPDSMEARVAHNLARIGDEINRQYGHRLDSMIKILPADECPIETFSNVARILFSRGPTNWGQVVALFCFGYRLVMRRVRSGLLAAFYQVCKSLLTFCSQMNVFAWIAAQGGWRIVQFLTMRSSTGHSGETEDDSNPVPGSESHDPFLRTWSIRDDLTLNINPRSATVWLVGIVTITAALYVYRRSYR